jgi:putative DNA primase/helicase
MNRVLPHALVLAAKGLRLFPQDRGKVPCIKAWPQAATADVQQLTRWGDNFPTANFAVATGGQSGVVVLDVDVKNNQPGAESLAKMKEQNGDFDTYTVRTPSGGWHFYFKAPEQQLRSHPLKDFPGVELKAEGAAVTMAGSFYANGAEYKCINDVVFSPCPDWLVELGARPAVRVVPDTGDGTIREGSRNGTLTVRAGRLRRVGASYEAILAELKKFNAEKCSPPLPDGELETIAHSVAAYNSADPLLLFKRSDTGNAERFLHLFSDRVRFVDDYKSWHVWKDGYWKRDNKRVVKQFGAELIRRLYHVGMSIEDEGERGEFIHFVASVDRRSRINDAIEMASSDPKVALEPGDLDRDTMLLNVKNGSIELATMTFREHRQEDYCTRQAGVAYDPAAECPTWKYFLAQVFNGNEELETFVQRAVGYSLTGDVSEQCFFILYGTGSNGKSTLLEVVTQLLGHYAARTPVETIMIKKDAGIPNDVARLKGARLVHTVETEAGKRLAESMVKSLTGGDTMVARFLHAEFFEFHPQFKLWLATNHEPKIRGQDLAIWRRIHEIPFDVKFEGDARDPKLLGKLLSELPGVLNWALEGCRLWQGDGLKVPAVVKAATDKYRTEQDSLAEFFEECCIRDRAADVSASDLYQAYRRYVERTGDHLVSQTVLGSMMRERGFERKHGRSGNMWIGISLLPPSLSGDRV